MLKYLNPKADLTFKKVFGEYPNLVAMLLNSLLQLPGGEEIAGIEYISPERVPRPSVTSSNWHTGVRTRGLCMPNPPPPLMA